MQLIPITLTIDVAELYVFDHITFLGQLSIGTVERLVGREKSGFFRVEHGDVEQFVPVGAQRLNSGKIGVVHMRPGHEEHLGVPLQLFQPIDHVLRAPVVVQRRRGLDAREVLAGVGRKVVPGVHVRQAVEHVRPYGVRGRAGRATVGGVDAVHATAERQRHGDVEEVQQRSDPFGHGPVPRVQKVSREHLGQRPRPGRPVSGDDLPVGHEPRAVRRSQHAAAAVDLQHVAAFHVQHQTPLTELEVDRSPQMAGVVAVRVYQVLGQHVVDHPHHRLYPVLAQRVVQIETHAIVVGQCERAFGHGRAMFSDCCSKYYRSPCRVVPSRPVRPTGFAASFPVPAADRGFSIPAVCRAFFLNLKNTATVRGTIAVRGHTLLAVVVVVRWYSARSFFSLYDSFQRHCSQTTRLAGTSSDAIENVCEYLCQVPTNNY